MSFLRVFLLTGIILISFAHIAWADVTYTVRDGDTPDQIAAKFHISVDDLLENNDLKPDAKLKPGEKLIIPYSRENEKPVQSPTIDYKVKNGDCLARIARKFDCEIDDLCDLNGIKRSKVLRIGQIILVPNPDYDVSEIRENIFKAPKEVQVDVTREQIKGKNLLDLSQIEDAKITITEPQPPDTSENESEDKSGEVEKEPERITVVEKTIELPKKKSEQKTEKPVKENGFVVHKVKKGESVYRIARQYDVSPQSILDANNLSLRSVLRIGETLKIPSSKASAIDPGNPFGISQQKTSESQLISRKLSKRDKLVRDALEYKGVRYRYGGTSKKNGVDCSGFVMKVYEKYGVQLPHSASAQSHKGKKVSKSELIPGDLIFFRNGKSGISHVGIYIGDGKFVHASTTFKQVQVDRLSSPYFTRNYVTARRIL